MNQKLKAFLKDPMGNISDCFVSWALFISMSFLMGATIGLIVCKIFGK